MTGRQQGRDAPPMRDFREFQAKILAMQPDVGDHQMDVIAFDFADRFLEIIEGRDYLIAEGRKHGFGVKRRQRLILDDEDPLDDPLALTEQHCNSNRDDRATATNEP